MNGVQVYLKNGWIEIWMDYEYEKNESRDERIMSLKEGWIKIWMENESMRRMDQEMNGIWVYEKDGSRDEWIKGWMN